MCQQNPPHPHHQDLVDQESDWMKSSIREQRGSMKPDQDLVLAGFVGQAGARVIAIEKEAELEQWFAKDYIEQIKENQNVHLTGNLEQWREFGATECEPVGEGGVYTALWNLSGAYEVGIECVLHQIPIKQETIEICERYDLNPYRLLSENCLLLVADNGGHLAAALSEKGISAAVIGKVNPGIKREIYNGTGRGFLDRPKKDELKKVVPSYFLL